MLDLWMGQTSTGGIIHESRDQEPGFATPGTIHELKESDSPFVRRKECHNLPSVQALERIKGKHRD